MKTLLITTLLFSVMVLSSVVYAGSHKYAEIETYQWNSLFDKMYPTTLTLMYNPVDSVVSVYFKDGMYTIAFDLYPRGRRNLVAAIDKFNEWKTKAINMKVKLNKDIDTIRVKPYFYLGDEWHRGNNTILKAKFFSQSTIHHQFLLDVNRIEDMSNEYITTNPDILYFESEQVNHLKFLLSSAKLEKVAKEIREKEELEKQFE